MKTFSVFWFYIFWTQPLIHLFFRPTEAESY